MFRIAVTLLAYIAIASITPASAQQMMCAERADLLGGLSTKYSEVPVAMGIANNGGVLEILAARAAGNWTIILTMPDGLSCVLASGENWESLPILTRLDPPV